MKEIRDWEYYRVMNILNMDSLDRVIKADNGELCTLGDTIGDSSQASFLKLKAILLSLVKTDGEKDVIELLSNGYLPQEAADELKCSKQNVNQIIMRIRKRCQELKILGQPKRETKKKSS